MSSTVDDSENAAKPLNGDGALATIAKSPDLAAAVIDEQKHDLVKSEQKVSSKAKKPRDPWFDNIRLTAAILIVLGHFISEMVQMENGWHKIWMMTWAMRVPVFVLISGYFSWGGRHTKKSLLPLVRNVLFVYLAFDVISTILEGIHQGKWVFNPWVPSFGLWFLLALVMWRLALPFLLKIPYVTVLASIVAIAVGFIPWIEGPLSLSRTIVLLPVFLIGYKLKTLGMRNVLDNTKARVIAVIVLLGYWAFMYFNSGTYRRSFLGFGDPYLPEYGPVLEQVVARSAALIAAVLVGMAVITLVPRVKIPFISYLGSGAFYIYLIHPILFREARWHGVYEWIDSDWKGIVFVLCAIIVSVLCATKPVRKLLGWLIQPKYRLPFLSEKKPAHT